MVVALDGLDNRFINSLRPTIGISRLPGRCFTFTTYTLGKIFALLYNSLAVLTNAIKTLLHVGIQWSQLIVFAAELYFMQV